MALHGTCTGGKSCCGGASCFRQHQWYSQCLDKCPGGDWECAKDPSPPPAPSPAVGDDECAAEWATCGGNGWESACCAGLECVRANQWFAMCRQASAEPLLALMSQDAALVQDVVHRFQNATNSARPNAPIAGAPILATGAANGGAATQCAQSMTIALSVSLSLVAVVCLVLMFVLGWHCRGTRMRTHVVAAHGKGATVHMAAVRASEVPVTILDLESAAKPPPPAVN